jgi:hypothetical protein
VFIGVALKAYISTPNDVSAQMFLHGRFGNYSFEATSTCATARDHPDVPTCAIITAFLMELTRTERGLRV